MGKNFDTLLKKLNEKPIPNDITFHEIERIIKHYGCEVSSGGNHKKIIYKKGRIVIPIPVHGKCVPEAYIKQIKSLIEQIEME